MNDIKGCFLERSAHKSYKLKLIAEPRKKWENKQIISQSSFTRNKLFMLKIYVEKRFLSKLCVLIKINLLIALKINNKFFLCESNFNPHFRKPLPVLSFQWVCSQRRIARRHFMQLLLLCMCIISFDHSFMKQQWLNLIKLWSQLVFSHRPHLNLDEVKILFDFKLISSSSSFSSYKKKHHPPSAKHIFYCKP